MQWEFPKPKPKLGDTRIVTRFAWLPVFARYNGTIAMRWLERVSIRQEWTSRTELSELSFAVHRTYYWSNQEFVDPVNKSEETQNQS